ncbi:MAG: hypothetical protein JSU72_00680 [Deltaproteobacteria bacterium]|nr:MAG: hypothetical protein JSU72_00680 [Deltaproteobacteria bacterium]
MAGLTFVVASAPLTSSLWRIPFGAMVDRMGGKKPILILLSLAVAGIGAITAMFALFSPPQRAHYISVTGRLSQADALPTLRSGCGPWPSLLFRLGRASAKPHPS